MRWNPSQSEQWCDKIEQIKLKYYELTGCILLHTLSIECLLKAFLCSIDVNKSKRFNTNDVMKVQMKRSQYKKILIFWSLRLLSVKHFLPQTWYVCLDLSTEIGALYYEPKQILTPQKKKCSTEIHVFLTFFFKFKRLLKKNSKIIFHKRHIILRKFYTWSVTAIKTWKLFIKDKSKVYFIDLSKFYLL